MKTMLSLTKKLLVVAALSVPVVFISCRKDNEENTVTEDEAAEVMVQSVDPASGGLVVQTYYTVGIASIKSISANCGVSKDTTFSLTAASANRTYSFNLNWNRLLTCNNSIPSRFDYTFTGSSVYTGPYMASDDKSTGTFSVTGLEPSATSVTVSHNYVRTGTQVSKVRNQRSFSSLVTIKSTNVVINKSTQEIVSGTAAVTISGNASTGESFSYSGTLTYLGNRKATLVTGKGVTYNIQW